jgi:hypothetical protein
MIDESIYYRHYQLAVNKIINGISCVDSDHEILHPLFDFDTEKVQFICLSCNYKVTPGLEMYEKMRSEVEETHKQLPTTTFWNNYE